MHPLMTSIGDEAFNITTTKEEQEIKLIFTLPVNMTCSRFDEKGLTIDSKYLTFKGVFWNGNTDRNSMRHMIGKEDTVQT